MFDLSKVFRNGKGLLLSMLLIIGSLILIAGVAYYLKQYDIEKTQELVKHTNIPVEHVEKMDYNDDNKSDIVKGSEFLKKLRESDTYDPTKKIIQVDDGTLKKRVTDHNDTNTSPKEVFDIDKETQKEISKVEQVLPENVSILSDGNGTYIVKVGNATYKVDKVEGLPKCSKEDTLEKITIVKTIKPKHVSSSKGIWNTYSELFEGEL